MAREINKGVVYTEFGCAGCNQCIAVCPVEGANVAKRNTDATYVVVDQDECVTCGRCVSVCPHEKRKYRDDSRVFLDSLADGEELSVILDDTFYYEFSANEGQMLAYLRKIGVKHIYDASIGSDINFWISANLINENKDVNDTFISSSCPAVVMYLRRYTPGLIKKRLPVRVPALATLIYVRKYLHDNNNIAIISSCAAMKEFLKLPENRDLGVKYCVMIPEFIKQIDDLTFGDEISKSDAKGHSLFPEYVFHNGFRLAMSEVVPPEVYIASASFNLDEREKINPDSILFRRDKENNEGIVVIDAMASSHGCLACSSKKNDVSVRERAFAHFHKYFSVDPEYLEYKSLPNDEKLDFINNIYKDLDFTDFLVESEEDYQQLNLIPQNVIDEVLTSLHKTTYDERHHDCRSCGYGNCMEMARAIALGVNVPQNCVMYAKGELSILYHTDKLTGAPNMDQFSLDAAQILNENRGYKFVMGWVDIKKLRIINDVLGHDSGDDVLRKAASVIEKSLPNYSCYGRFADDSFVFMVPYWDGVCETAKEIADKASKEYKERVPVGVDMGFYEIEPGDPDIPFTVKDISVFADNARIAFDSIKGGYDTRVGVYTDEMKKNILRESELTSLMNISLARGDFKTFFQPLYDHSTGKMVGAEALARWIMEGRGNISPGQFVPLFEKNGFILKLDQFIWESTIRLLAAWSEAGYELVPVSVNISRIDIYFDELPDYIADLTDRYRLDRRYLRLEITESAYMSSPERINSMINRFHKYGFLVEMDDFGSGYSSLNVLKDMNVDILKLDLKFLAGGNEDRGGKIINSVVKMADALNISVIAEGVETKEQADFMLSVGARTIQGYYYAKPMPSFEFEKKLNHRGKR